jgi:hypothetical protein
MSPDSPRAYRAGLRLLAAAAAGCTAAAAFAVPAAAVDIPGIEGDPIVENFFPDSVVGGEEAEYGPVIVEFTPATGDEDMPHDVTAKIVFDGGFGDLDFSLNDSCTLADGEYVHCEDHAVDSGYARFGINVSAAADAAAGVFTYNLTVEVDGIEIVSTPGAIELFPPGLERPHQPFIHGDVAASDAAPGSSVAVNPVFLQERPLYETAAAVVVSFGDPFSRIGMDLEGAEAVAGYDNCAEGRWGSDRGVTCVFTDITDAAGTPFTLSDPVAYEVAADAVGPIDTCHCGYTVSTVNAGTLATEYGHITWDPASENLLEIVPAESWDGPGSVEPEYSGEITFDTTANPYDLAVENLPVTGVIGDRTTLTAVVANNGPASAPLRLDYHGSYSVRVQLPTGTELVNVDAQDTEAWQCLEEDDLGWAYEDAAGTTELDHFDLVCYVDRLGTGESLGLDFTVDITAANGTPGLIEVAGEYRGSEHLDGDTANNLATIENQASEILYDYNDDGYSDLLAVRKSDGALRFYAGTSTGTYQAAVTAGTGWGRMDIVMAGDLTGDGRSDFLARDTKTGVLYTYPGNGKGGHGTRITVGTGWNGMGQIAVGNFDGVGALDVFATSFADDKLYYYPGKGNGTFGARQLADDEWEDMDVITNLGDVNGDGFDEIVARWNDYGYYYLFDGYTGEFTEIDPALGDALASRRYTQVVGVGDHDLDGYPDLASVDSRTGQLLLHSFDEHYTPIHDGEIIGASGWGAMRLPVLQLDQVYDLDSTGTSDIVALRKSDSDVFFYPGTGTGLGARVQIGNDWKGANLFSTAGDVTGDGFGDLLVRYSSGQLFIAVGNSGGFVSEWIEVGPGWNAMSTISGGQDFNSDGKADILAVQPSNGTMYFYPGKGDGKFGARVAIGPGWNAMKEVTAVGDLDHDGHADMLAVTSSDGCLYFYGGTGAGTFKSRVKIGCGWGAMDAITGVGDFNRDGHVDWAARRKSDGNLFVYYGNGAGNHGTKLQLGTGWNAMNLA